VNASGDLVVDLSELAFADSSLIFDLAVLAQRTRSQGRCIWVRNAQPQTTRLIELVGLDRQPGVEMS
jgi:anti-anti-sigma regulatory factor